ncbi:MAG: extradiol dioxygenase [Chloroflexi bacterium]|nr:MAG: extradiol dioxygenase [Chloroflexota bacterium]TME48391.1 MAG: extradiol dioxygenase [Chloroflexota bacterium]
MISGVHALLYSKDPVADRVFFRDVLGLASVDSGDGWLIFALPPAELAIHPAEDNGRHQLYLLCDDIEATAKMLAQKGVQLRGPIEERNWGRVGTIPLPGGGELGIYQPNHPLAHSRVMPGGAVR